MSADKLEFASFDTPPEASVAAVDRGLDEYNFSVAPLSDVRPLASFATDSTGHVVGGAIGRTWGRCCELLQLWVEPAHRATGVGSRLLRQFEAHATRRGCDVFYLTTLSYQAPDFYRKHGYAPLATIAGYPDGIAKYLMHKSGAGSESSKAPFHSNLSPPERMNAATIQDLANATLDGSMPFPEIVGRLIEQDVEYYVVDYRALRFTFYGVAGGVVLAPLQFEGLPEVGESFDLPGLRAAIHDSQSRGQKFRDFSARAMRAGVQSYYAFLRGKRVLYLGRKGDQHLEWFPGAAPSDA